MFEKYMNMLLESLTDPAGGGAADPAADPAPAADLGNPGALPVLAENWHENLPADMRNGMENYKDMGSIVKSLRHAQSMVGADKVVLPGKNSTPEDVSAFYQKLGQPKSLEDYDKALPFENTPEEAKATVKSFKEFAFKNNILPEQAKGIFEWLASTNKEAGETSETTRKNDLATEFVKLKGEWGEGYEKNLEGAKNAFRQLSAKVPGAQEWMEKQGLAGDPMMIKMFSLVGGMLKEGAIHDAGQGGTGQSHADLKRDINNIMADQTHAYHDKNHPNHKLEVDEMNKRYATLYPA